MDPRRSQRLSETLREELEELLAYEMTDPRIDVVSIPEVLISPDGKQARARLQIPGNESQQEETLKALASARGFIRREISHRLDLFRLPEIHFEAAIPAESPERITHLMRRIRRGRPRADTGEAGQHKASGK